MIYIQIHKRYGSGEAQDLQLSMEGQIVIQTQMVHFHQPENSKNLTSNKIIMKQIITVAKKFPPCDFFDKDKYIKKEAPKIQPNKYKR